MFELQAPPDYFGQFMAPLQRQQQLGIMQQNADAETAQAQTQAIKLASGLQQFRAYQADAARVMADPSPEGFRALMLKYPEMHDSLKGAWDNYGEAQKQRDTEGASQLYAALANGRSDLALQLLKDRKTALSGAGQDDKVTDSLIELVESGDPAKLKQAQGMAGFALASSTGPDKIGPMLEALGKKGDSYTLSPGETRYDAEGNVIAQSPFIKTDGGGVLVRDGTGGAAGGAVPNVAASVGGGADAAIEHVLGNEGGYNPKDANGAPTNFGINAKANTAELKKLGVSIKDLTRDQAKQIYAEKYWPASGAADLAENLQAPYFDVYIRAPGAAKRFLAQSGGDPAQFMQLADNFFGKLAKQPKYSKYARAWANRDAGNTAIAAGASSPAPASAAGAPAPPPGYSWLVPPKAASGGITYRILPTEEAKAMGLDPNIKYQMGSNGSVSALGGQNRQSKQIPQQVLSKVQPSIDVRDTISRLKANWKDAYGGHTVTGGALNSIQSVIDVGPEGMRDWWADFQSMDNLVRNQLFGSALTEHEKQAYAATTITPRMAPDQIKKNLQRRFDIVKAATSRQQNFLKKNGYDPDAVDALFQPLGGPAGGEQRTVVRTGVQKSTGKKVVQYSDGTIEVQ